MKVAVFGDSFAANDGDLSWTSLLSNEFSVDNFADRGISEYRIYKTIMNQNINAYDRVVIFHTNPDRIFVPDHVDHPSRQLHSHPHCDMLVNDSFDKSSWRGIAECYYKNFYDQDFQLDLFKLLIEKISSLCPRAVHCSGFDLSTYNIKSFDYLLKSNPGKINHLDVAGNKEVYQYVRSQLV